MGTDRFNRHARLRIAAGSLAFVAALTLSGCTNPFEDVVEGITGPQNSDAVDERREKTAEVEGGELGSSEIPADFPDTIPLPDRKPTNVVRYTEGNVVSWALQYRDENGPAMVEDLGQELIALGFSEDSNLSLGDEMTVALYTKDEYTVTLTMLGEEGDRVLQILVMQLDED